MTDRWERATEGLSSGAIDVNEYFNQMVSMIRDYAAAVAVAKLDLKLGE
jgi:hypothetical protein